MIAVRGKGVVILLSVELHEQADLSEIVQASDAFTFGFGTSQRRQQHRGENCDYRNDNQQLNKRNSF